ncbi:putative indole-3-acetic acid-amido synthetase GH3.6-like [Capsicum annuum]|nr:putative indole-3-acetic acid-amido synthetase GH3.6-like [Capsicum annuum]
MLLEHSRNVDLFRHVWKYVMLQEECAQPYAGLPLCLDGSPPAYYFDPGFGDGVDNWIVQISGGAWCVNVTDCIGRTKTQLGSSKYMDKLEFQGIHSKNKSANPDFYNWNKVILAYCDGGSFVGDVEYVDSALLAGGSAGGYPAVLYCDNFRDSLPSAARVKCLNDCGYFPHFKNPELEKNWHVRFSGVAELQCLYSQNIQQDIKTPLFIFMSAYDNVETKYTFGDYMGGLIDGGKCSASQNQSLIEMRSEFLNALPKGDNPNLRGVFVDSVHHHNSLLRRWIPETAINVNGQCSADAGIDSVLKYGWATYTCPGHWYTKIECRESNPCGKLRFGGLGL